MWPGLWDMSVVYMLNFLQCWETLGTQIYIGDAYLFGCFRAVIISMLLCEESRTSQLLCCLLLVLSASAAPPSHGRKTCTVKTYSNGTDDTPAILAAFKECGKGGNVVFLNETYYVNSVMNTTGLCDCEIDLYGTLLVGSEPNYDAQPVFAKND